MGNFLSDEQVKFFHENGYLHLRGVFTEEECVEIIESAEICANGHYTNYIDMHLRSPALKKAITGKKLCDIGDDIFYGQRAVPVGSGYFFCKPGNPLEHGSTWHQDNYAPKAVFGCYLNLGLALDDADASNGALQIIPKSHLLGDLPCDPKANFSYDDEGKLYNSAPIGNNCEVPSDLSILQLEYKRGDVICIHAQLVHRADRNDHPTRWRRKAYLDYIKDGEPFWPGWTAKRMIMDRYDSPRFGKAD